MNSYLKLAVFGVTLVGYYFGKALAEPFQLINGAIDKAIVEWPKTKEHQSITDRFLARRISADQYRIMMDSMPARLLWVNLTTRFPEHKGYIFQQLRARFPNTNNFTV